MHWHTIMYGTIGVSDKLIGNLFKFVKIVYDSSNPMKFYGQIYDIDSCNKSLLNKCLI